MSLFTLQPAITLFLGLGFVLLAIGGIITETIWKSLHIKKVDVPKLRLLLAIAFLQILLGVMTVFVVKGIKDDPFIAIGTGCGITILSGLFFLKLILKNSWKQSLGVWALASVMQLVLVPICSTVLLVGWVMALHWLYPPQY
jgi:hypothetical protein